MSAYHTLPHASLLLAGSSALALLAAPALAAPDVPAAAAAPAAADAGIDLGSDIVVTARHRTEKVQSIPIAVSVLSEATLERAGDTNLNQIQHEIPSLQVVNSNPRNTNITIRGLGANSSLAVDGLEYGVGFYLDGVYYARPGQTQFDLIDLSQVEVLRGPQGTLFGKNTTAGAINVTSRLPSFTPELTAEGSLGNYDFAQVRVSASAPLIADKVAFRLSISDTHRNGFLTNTYNNTQADKYDDFSIRGQLLIVPDNRLTIRLIGDYSNQRQNPALGQIDGYFTTFSNGAAVPYNILQRAAALGYALPASNAFSRLIDYNSHFQANMKSFGGSAQIDADAGGVKLTSITAYRKWNWLPANDGDDTGLPINLKAQQENFQRQFSQELRVASQGHHFIDYQGGLYYFWQTVPGYGANQYGSDFAAYNLNPATVPAATIANTALALTNFEADSYSVANTRSYAAFGQGDVHLTDRLTFTGGLRFTHEDKNGEYVRQQVAGSGLDLSGLSPAQLATIGGIRNAAAYQLGNLAFTARTHNSAVSGLATLGYEIARDVLVYGTYSRGSQSGGLNITAGGAAQPVVAPETVNNYELGVKSQLLNRTLTVNLAAFRTDVSDFQANITVPIAGSTAIIQYIANIPKVRSQGIEADAGWSPSRWVNLGTSLAYTDAKYVSYANAPNAPENNPAATPPQHLSGAPLAGVSKFAYTLSADVAHPVQGNFEAYAHADYLHRSSFNTTATNSIYGIVPHYGLLNARIGLRTPDNRYDVSLWVRNLTNADYYISRGATNYGLITAVTGDPRTFGATVRVKI